LGSGDSADADNRYIIHASTGEYTVQSLVIATGGLSVTKMGASDFGLQVARQFEMNVISTRPGLVPLTYNAKNSKQFKALSGIALNAQLSYKNHAFKEKILV
jgi:predicted flavoprotein YhiN